MTEEQFFDLYVLGETFAGLLHEIISLRIATLEDKELIAFYAGLRDTLILDVQ